MIILVNKPPGWTSFDVVAYIRKQIRHSQNNKLQAKNCKLRVGHAGTLDPFATGLLIVGVGREATKKLEEFKNLPKTYVATLKLGYVSDTFDKTGKIEKYDKSLLYCHIVKLFNKIFNKNSNLTIQQYSNELEEITIEKIKKVLSKFNGQQKQIPPMFSAKKVNGKKLYELARKGITIKRKKNNITIFNIKILSFEYPFLKIEVECSAGTYIRSLANDIGKKLGCGAYCEELTRTKIGDYKLENAQPVQSVL